MTKACLLQIFLLSAALLLDPSRAFMVVSPSTSSRMQSSQPLHFFKFPNVLESILPSDGSSATNEASSQRESLKQTLLEECRSTTSTREKIEAIMNQLQEVNPTPASASSPLLQKKWALEWTTEKEINFFLDWNLSDEIGQTIDGPKLDNNIEFIRGGGFYVSGKLTKDADKAERTNFEFEIARLDLGKWGKYEFPPIGAGWFDTIYLDETLRVDTNSRDDILICTPY